MRGLFSFNRFGLLFGAYRHDAKLVEPDFWVQRDGAQLGLVELIWGCDWAKGKGSKGNGERAAS